MELALRPEPDEAVATAVAAALCREGVDLGDSPASHRSAWRAAGLREGVDRMPSPFVRPDYAALSPPRSTPGATRA